MNSDQARELNVLEALQQQPDVRQVDLASQLGVAVGTTNWLIKRLVSKGYVKARRIGQWRWRYLITPQGLAAKTRLTQRYLKDSMRLYRLTRDEARRLLSGLKKSGYDHVYLKSDSGDDLLDVCRLTCLEQGIEPVSIEEDGVPILRVTGQELTVSWPEAVSEEHRGVEQSA